MLPAPGRNIGSGPGIAYTADAMNTIAIGDIHGRRVALEELLNHLDPERDRLVFLGDYCDRGPDTRGVLDLLVNIAAAAPETVFLRGNHDAMMVMARLDPTCRTRWLQDFEGSATMRSYGSTSLAAVPDRHWLFLEQTCRNWYATHNHLFVHGGVNPELPMDGHPVRDLHWRRLHDALPHVSGKRVICGHTQQRAGLPYNMGHTVCIDTRGWLTALNVNDNTFIQVSNEGEFRSFDRLPPVAPPPPPKPSRRAPHKAADPAPAALPDDEAEAGV